MSKQILSNSKIWLGQYDLSGNTNALAMEAAADPVVDTCFGATFITRKPGIKSTTFQVDGYADHVIDTDAGTFTPVGLSDTLLSIGPAAALAGEVGYLAKVNVAKFETFGAHGEMFPFTAGGEINGEVYRGTIMHQATATASAAGTAYQLGALSATQKLYAILHIPSRSGTSPTLDIDIESDDNSGMTSAVVRGSFTQVTAAGAQWITPIDGAITDDYWRVNFTIGGTDTPTFEFVVMFAVF